MEKIYYEKRFKLLSKTFYCVVCVRISSSIQICQRLLPSAPSSPISIILNWNSKMKRIVEMMIPEKDTREKVSQSWLSFMGEKKQTKSTKITFFLSSRIQSIPLSAKHSQQRKLCVWYLFDMNRVLFRLKTISFLTFCKAKKKFLNSIEIDFASKAFRQMEAN